MRKIIDLFTSSHALAFYGGLLLSQILFYIIEYRVNFVFKEWQTLIAGMLALCAAGVAYWQYRDSLYRKNISARAKMMDALADVCEFAKQSFLNIEKNQEIPNQKSNGIDVLKEGVEGLDRKTADTFHDLFVHYQVHNSRNLRGPQGEKHGKEYLLYDSLLLYVLASSLFDYARKKDVYGESVKTVENAKPSLQSMFSGLRAITDMWADQIEELDYENPRNKLMELVKERHV